MIDRPQTLELLGRQFAVATIPQLVATGTSRRSVGRALEARVLVKVVGSVVRLAGVELTFEGRAMATLLHCGPRSFLSGVSAARLHGVRYMRWPHVEATVLNRVPVAVPTWMRASRTTWMLGGDIVDHPAGFRIASPLRTLHRLGGLLNAFRFERAAEDYWHLGLVTPTDAREYLARMRRQGRTGVSRLDAWLVDVAGRKRPTQGGLEMDALEAIRAVGLPKPSRQHPVTLRSGEVVHIDVAWPGIKLGVEPGHSWWHGGDLKQRADQARDRACAEVGWQILRFDEHMRADLRGAAQQIQRVYATRAV